MAKKILISLLLALLIGVGGALEYTFQVGEGLRAHWSAKRTTRLATAAVRHDAGPRLEVSAAAAHALAAW